MQIRDDTIRIAWDHAQTQPPTLFNHIGGVVVGGWEVGGGGRSEEFEKQLEIISLQFPAKLLVSADIGRHYIIHVLATRK